MKQKLTYLFSLLLTALFLLPWSGVKAETLTVADGTNENSYVPLYGNWADAYQHFQVIYPSTDLSAMNGKQIKSMKFYLKSINSTTKTWNGTFKIRLAETTESSFSGSFLTVTGDPLYSGALDGTSKELTITFSTAYTYKGGNLVFDLQDETSGDNYNSSSFYGVSGSQYTSIGNYSQTSLAAVEATNRQFTPKTTFTYEEPANPNCADVAGLIKGEVTATTAAFSWIDATVEEWQYVCLPAATAVDWTDGTKVKTTTTNSVSISDLDANTDYKFYVRANCGSANGNSRASSVAFKTPCAAIATMPTYGFEDNANGSFPDCWNKISPSAYPQVYEYSDYAKEGNKSLYFYMANPQYAILPVFSQDIKNLTISFWYRNYAYNEVLEVGYMSDPTNANTFVSVETLPYITSYNTDATDVSFSSAPENVRYIAFKYTCTSSNYGKTFVDNVSVSVAASCSKPTGLAVSSTTPEGAVLTWNGTVDNYQYAVVAKDAAAPTSWTDLVGAKTVTITGKAAGTAYDFYVRSNCGSSQSDPVKVSFTPVCPAPTAPAVSDITASTATASWTAAAGITTYKYLCVESGVDTTGLWASAASVNDVTVNLTSLDASTSYDFYVRSFYSATSVSSSAVKKTFKTECATYPMPFEENFNVLTSGIPDCWDNSKGTTSTASYRWNYYTASTGMHDGACVRFDSYANGTNKTDTLATPTISITEAAVLKFWWKNPAGGDYSVKIAVDGGAKADLKTNMTSQSAWKEETFDLSSNTYVGHTVVVYFCAKSNYGSDDAYLYLDDVRIIAKPSCSEPTGLTKDATTPDGATFSWNGDASNYQYGVVAKDAAAPTSWTLLEGEKTVTVTGKTAGTAYDFYVRSYCSGSSQSDAVKASFTPVCPAPTAPLVNAITTTTATASWTAATGITTYKYLCVESGADTTGLWASAASVNNVTVNLTSLEASTSYDFYVRSFYSATSAVSGSVKTTFKTECNAVTGIGFAEDFDDETSTGSGNRPDCWKNVGGNYPYTYSSSYYAHSSSKALYFYGGTSSSEQIAILPKFAEIANQTKTLQITLWYSNYSSDYTGTNYASPQVGWITDPADATTFHAAETLAKVSSYTQATIALAGAPANSFVAIRYGGGSSAGLLLVDDIEISEAPSCLKPTGVAGTATAYNSASISWTKNGSETAWQIRYSSDAGENWTAPVDANTNPFTLSELLSGNSDYIVQVRANCGDGEENKSEWSDASASFHTPCAPQDASDYTENFDGTTAGSGNLPGCWEYTESYTYWGDKYPYVYAGSAASGSNSLRFYGGIAASSQQTVTLPKMDRTINTLSVEFDYIASESAYSTWAKLVLGYIASNDEFTAIETLDYAASYTHYKKALSSVPSEAKNIAIRYTGGTGNGSAYIDNVHVFPTPSCVEPTGVAGANMTANSAEISWTAGGSETAWKLQYTTVNPASATDGDWIDANSGNDITTNPYTLNGLNANTLYYARVKAICSSTDASGWSTASAAFRTECAAVAANGWATGFESSEGFAKGSETSAAPSCWALLNANDGTSPYIFVNNSSGFVQNGNQSLYFNGSGSRYGYIILPEFSGSLSTFQMVFSHIEESDTKSGIITLGYMTNIANAETFTTLKECTRSTSWQEETISLATVPANARLAFSYGGGTGGWFAGIDDIRIEVAPTCPKPTAVTVSSITAHTAQVAWTNGGTETAWALQTSEDGTNWGAEIAANANPFTLTGLDANATYYVRVKAVCSGEDQSEWSAASAAFNTPCEALALGWTENFDDASALPECWSATATGTSGNQWNVSNFDEYHSESNSARYNGRTYTSYSADLVTAPITISTNDAVLGFWYKNAVTAEVYINDGESTTKLWDITSASSWKEKIIDLSSYNGKTVKFIFRGHGYSTSSTKYLYIDDIRVLRNLTFADDDENNDAKLAAVNGQTVDVTIGRTITCTGYFNTLCLPFDLSAEELAEGPLAGAEIWAFKYAKVDEATDELLFRIIESDHIEAGKPYFIQFAAGDAIENPLFKNVTISASAGQKIGDENMAQLCGILKPETFTPGDKTKLFLYNENALYWWKGASESALKSFRAYFYVNTTTSGANYAPRHGMRARIIKEEQTVTGINNTNVENVTLKFIENDQVVIIRNGVKYNIQGQVISK